MTNLNRLIVSLTKHPRASVGVGSVALPGKLAHAIAPNLVGRVTRWLIERALESADPVPVTEGSSGTTTMSTALRSTRTTFTSSPAHVTARYACGTSLVEIACVSSQDTLAT